MVKIAGVCHEPPMSTQIFAYFLRDKVLKLRESAKELDEEYEEGLDGKAP